MAEGPERAGQASEQACDSPTNGVGLLTTSAEKARGSEREWETAREGEKERKRSEEKRARRNGRTCDSMRFTAALRRFIAPSKHKMPGREACIRVGTPPLHFYRQLPVKPGNIPPISCSRERSHPAISNSLSLFLSLLPNAVTSSLLSLLFHLPARLTPFLISRILFAVSRPVSSRKVHSLLFL